MSKLKNMWLLGISLFLLHTIYALNSNELLDIDARSLSGGAVEVKLTFTAPPNIPKYFSLHNPNRIVLDLPNTRLNDPKLADKKPISFDMIEKYDLATNGNNLRLILFVSTITPLQLQADRNTLVLTLSEVRDANSSVNIKTVDFRRGDGGSGKLFINFDDTISPIDVRDDQHKTIITIQNANIPNNLLKKMDVSDFATPISFVTLQKEKQNVVVTIEANADYNPMTLQMEDELIFEARPLSYIEQVSNKGKLAQYKGDKISLNFQDIEVRAVLQLLSEFSGKNLVASDSVSGSVTLKLENVPWDEALDFILKSKGLAQRESGNVVLIAPIDEFTNSDKTAQESQEKEEEVAPLVSEYMQINYAKATDLSELITGDGDNSMLSTRGVISVDERTNQLLIKDTQARINDVRQLINKLDVPVKQVMIEAQIVVTNEQLTDELGINWNTVLKAKVGKYGLGMAGTDMSALSPKPGKSAQDIAQSRRTSGPDRLFPIVNTSNTDSLNLGFAIANLPGGTLLNLELRAKENENITHTISKPKIITEDQKTATIESGQEVPYQILQSQGVSTVQFKDAKLKLEVTPHITPDNRISLELSINSDTVGKVPTGGTQAALNTNSIKTTVLVNNGATIVLGGLIAKTDKHGKTSLPWVHKLPIIGRLFEDVADSTEYNELLIFVTPSILDDLKRAA